MNVQHLAIASVPIQSWGSIYDSSVAINKGTIFQDLDLPFFAADKDENQISDSKQSGKADAKQLEREEKMMQIYETCFVVDDLRLYLDTHPKDDQALQLLKTNLVRRRHLLDDFSSNFYPLTMDCMAEACGAKSYSGCYCWQEGPMPWEGGCV